MEQQSLLSKSRKGKSATPVTGLYRGTYFRVARKKRLRGQEGNTAQMALPSVGATIALTPSAPKSCTGRLFHCCSRLCKDGFCTLRGATIKLRLPTCLKSCLRETLSLLLPLVKDGFDTAGSHHRTLRLPPLLVFFLFPGASPLQFEELRMDLNRSWHVDHSHTYNAWFCFESSTKDLSSPIFRSALQLDNHHFQVEVGPRII